MMCSTRFYNPGGGFMDGALMRIYSFSSAGTLTGSQVENWDSEGIFLGWSRYDGLGKEIFHTRFKGNASPAAGGMTQSQWTQYDPDGKLSNVDWSNGTADYDPPRVQGEPPQPQRGGNANVA